MFSKVLARQLGSPSGYFGRLVLPVIWNRRNAALNQAALERIQLTNKDRVLEVGFGGGYLLGKMLPILTAGSVSGVDISLEMVANARRAYHHALQTGRLKLYCAGVEALPFSANSFEKACSINSIFYWEDPSGAVQELRRVLQNGGQLILCFTCREYLQDRIFAANGLNLFEGEEVKIILSSAGFHEVIASRLRDRYREFWCISAIK